MKETFTDEEIITAINQGGSSLNQVMDFIYKNSGYKNSIEAYIQQKKGNEQDAQDIFQDGIRHLIINIRKGNFKGQSTIRTYLTTICKNLWYTRFARANKLTEITDTFSKEEGQEESPEDILMLKERAALIKNILQQLGDSCRKVLGLWSLSYSFKEIGHQMGKSEGAVRKQKLDCFKKLMLLLKGRPDLVKEIIGR